MSGWNVPALRVGNGFDVHRLVSGRRLVLCGVTVPYELGLEGHSDADVAAHALMDALLGAGALGDIGHLFPDTDAAYLDADSMVLLAEVCKRLQSQGWQIVNVDVTVIAQRPKLAPFIMQMRQCLADVMHIGVECVSVKATTTEHLGFTGRGEGIAAQAVALIGR